jgi:hypothetical protein
MRTTESVLVSTTIETEWMKYQNHFDLPPETLAIKHAFHMGMLRMLQLSQTRSRAQLKRLAAELDRHLAQASDDCLCDDCREIRARGKVPFSLVDDLFRRATR